MRATTMTRALPILATALFLAWPVDLSYAGPASDVITTLNSNIVRIMQNAKALGYKGRYKEFEPVLQRTFDMPTMAQLAIGRKWAELTPPQQQKVIDTFRRYTTALYASRFDGYSNQKFEILGERAGPNGILVRNQFVDSKGKAVGINYVLKDSGGKMQAFDVYLNESISEVAVRRSEFANTINSQGVDALVNQIEQRIAAIEDEAIKKGG